MSKKNSKAIRHRKWQSDLRHEEKLLAKRAINKVKKEAKEKRREEALANMKRQREQRAIDRDDSMTDGIKVKKNLDKKTLRKIRRRKNLPVRNAERLKAQLLA
eukprot:Blabericola_migrator_1__7518@NODE_383_length_9140_cov_403_746611_g306_i0_p8_GENE_NODE_383_length_9140_cov_403_746611_g306_i0NODE_383_length_9140_cov_403_746611_g306_i0_p8_ORF_typecomplete_len103_score26_69HEPN_MAE_28990/PF18737_1/0_12DUF4629/PF15442_6/0_5DUF5526/PF17664_1/2_1Snurportin1/PF11538_8/0_1Snurportin1/PF11538_8/2e03_NODE_383_length_9140_cov_403_746611_g306_i027983106